MSYLDVLLTKAAVTGVNVLTSQSGVNFDDKKDNKEFVERVSIDNANWFQSLGQALGVASDSESALKEVKKRAEAGYGSIKESQPLGKDIKDQVDLFKLNLSDIMRLVLVERGVELRNYWFDSNFKSASSFWFPITPWEFCLKIFTNKIIKKVNDEDNYELQVQDKIDYEDEFSTEYPELYQYIDNFVERYNKIISDYNEAMSLAEKLRKFISNLENNPDPFQILPSDNPFRKWAEANKSGKYKDLVSKDFESDSHFHWGIVFEQIISDGVKSLIKPPYIKGCEFLLPCTSFNLTRGNIIQQPIQTINDYTLSIPAGKQYDTELSISIYDDINRTIYNWLLGIRNFMSDLDCALPYKSLVVGVHIWQFNKRYSILREDKLICLPQINLIDKGDQDLSTPEQLSLNFQIVGTYS